MGSEGSDRRDIKKNLIHCAVLKKLSKGFVSETAKKKFFVLYEDSRQSLSNPKAHTESEVSFAW